MNWLRILSIARKEVLQIRADPRMLRVLFLAPIGQIFVFGYAITTDITHISLAVLDQDRTAASRRLISRFEGAPETFQLRYRLERPDEIDQLLDHAQAQAALWIPKGYAARAAQGGPAPVQVVIDGADSRTAATISGYIQTVMHTESMAIRLQQLRHAGMGAIQAPVRAEPRVWYNPDLRSANYLVPGVLCLILLVVTMLLTSLAVVREREVGTLEQLNVTPLRPLELMLGKTLPFAVIGLIDAVLIVLAATLWFQVPVHGSLALLLGATLLFLFTTLGLGLLISTVSQTQQQAMMISFFVMQPSVLLSGFMFPVDSMPIAIEWLTRLIPLRYYLEVVRGIFLRGVGPVELWPQLLWLTVLGLALMTFSVRRFTKRAG